eukprot:2196066-Amphidinium_carterae.1
MLEARWLYFASVKVFSRDPQSSSNMALNAARARADGYELIPTGPMLAYGKPASCTVDDIPLIDLTVAPKL